MSGYVRFVQKGYLIVISLQIFDSLKIISANRKCCKNKCINSEKYQKNGEIRTGIPVYLCGERQCGSALWGKVKKFWDYTITLVLPWFYSR